MSPRRPGPLAARLAATAERRADAAAVTFLDARLDARTYGAAELAATAGALAERLAARVERGPVGLLLRRQEDQVLHYLACLAAGLTPAILAPPSPRIDRRWYDATARAAVHGRFEAIVTDVGVEGTGALALAPGTLEVLERATPGRTWDDPGSAAFLQFSSGTTGAKKGVLIPDERVLAQLDAYGSAIGIDGDDVVASWLPLYHDMGFVACLNLPLAAGAHLVLLEPLDWVVRPASLLAAIARHRATLTWQPNFAFALLAARTPASADVDLASLRGAVSCSEPTTFAAEDAFRARFRPHGLRADALWGCYAMAETTFALTHGAGDDPLRLDPVGPDAAHGLGLATPVVSVGRPLPGVELDVLGADGEPLPDGVVGELRVRAPFLADGYAGAGAPVGGFAADGYRTGDLGYVRDGRVFVCGRASDVIIVGGINVFPQDVEELVGAVPGVKAGRVVAFGVDDARQGTQRLVVLCEPARDALDDDALAEARRRVGGALGVGNVAVHAVPAGSLVKSSSGKLARAENRRRHLAPEADGDLRSRRTGEVPTPNAA